MILELLSLAGAGLAGAVAHELAHWAVWKATGRKPRLNLWKLVVRPRAGPQRTTPGDRIAAAAPYALGLLVGGYGVVVGNWPAIYFGVFAIQIPSSEDIAAVVGTAEWAIETR